jgi:hypothetical protein
VVIERNRMIALFDRQQHITDGSRCWCNPKVEFLKDGWQLFTHNY